MRRRILQLGLLALFVALIAAVPRLSRRSAENGRAGKTGNASAALARYGFRLDEVSEAAGVRFTHQAPRLDPKLDPILPRVADMGAGVAVSDFDRDGHPDIYATNSAIGSANHLFRNKGNGTFEDVAGTMGVADVNRDGTGVSMGAVWGDYDNDGFEDLLVYKWGRAELFHNENGKRFTRVTERAGLPPWMNANTAIWLDYDRDGKLDLLIGGYFDEKLDLFHLADTRIMPDSLEYATNGTRKHLLRGNGDGTFEDVTERVGITGQTWSLAAAAADLRGTGYPDLFIANDYGLPELYLNENGKRFREVGKAAGVAERPKSGMNAAFGDVENSGRLAVYVTNITEEGVLIQGNNLWVPRETTGSDGIPRFDNLASAMGVERGGWSFGAQFGDLNNDGNLDLFLTNGYISADPKQSYWYSQGSVSAGNKAIIHDAKNWPPIGNMSLSGHQNKRVWVSDGAGRFTDVAASVGVEETHDGRAVALLDYNNDGALDVVVAHQKGPLLLYKNTARPENRWIAFDLEGTRSNRSAIGAQVRLFWNGQQQLQEVSGGVGFCAQNQRTLHFGLGPNPKVEKAVIRWPSGKITTLNAPADNKVHRVKEPA